MNEWKKKLKMPHSKNKYDPVQINGKKIIIQNENIIICLNLNSHFY